MLQTIIVLLVVYGLGVGTGVWLRGTRKPAPKKRPKWEPKEASSTFSLDTESQDMLKSTLDKANEQAEKFVGVLCKPEDWNREKEREKSHSASVKSFKLSPLEIEAFERDIKLRKQKHEELARLQKIAQRTGDQRAIQAWQEMYKEVHAIPHYNQMLLHSASGYISDAYGTDVGPPYYNKERCQNTQKDSSHTNNNKP